MSTRTYRILVTNDDGVSSRGLGVLAQHLASAGHDVVVAAPEREASGSGAAVGGIMPGDTITTRIVELPDAPGVTAFSVDGAPGRCVLAAALGAFGAPPELVVSGINPGSNVGKFLQLHSGTLGAALTSAGFGINGMAVSIAGSEPTHWATAAIVATRLVDYLASSPKRTTLNLNLPDIPIDDVRGLRTAPVRRGSPERMSLIGSAPGVLSIGRLAPLDTSAGAGAATTATAAKTGDTDANLIDEGFAVLTRVLPPSDVAPEPFPEGII